MIWNENAFGAKFRTNCFFVIYLYILFIYSFNNYLPIIYYSFIIYLLIIYLLIYFSGLQNATDHAYHLTYRAIRAQIYRHAHMYTYILCVHQYTRSPLFLEMACLLSSAKPLHKPLMNYCQLDNWKFKWIYMHNFSFNSCCLSVLDHTMGFVTLWYKPETPG